MVFFEIYNHFIRKYPISIPVIKVPYPIFTAFTNKPPILIHLPNVLIEYSKIWKLNDKRIL